MARLASLALAAGACIGILAAGPASAQPANCAGNSNMCDALRNLEQARASLLRADANKGGYRKSALQSIDRAIRDVRAGIAYSQRR
jgi:hypothetical protein